MINYLQNEDLTSIGAKLGDHLANNKTLREYCKKRFLKNITVIVGADASTLPEESTAPYILINDLGKKEGATIKTAQYEATFCIGIMAKENEHSITEKGAIVLDGSQKLTEVMTLVQDALNSYSNGNRPPDDVEAVVLGRVGNNPNHWLGAISCLWNIELPLGRKEEF